MELIKVFWIITVVLMISVLSLYRYSTSGELVDLTKCGRKFVGAGMVFGGEKTTQNSWPWLVALFYLPKNQFFCGGSLISSKHVLSGEKESR